MRALATQFEAQVERAQLDIAEKNEARMRVVADSGKREEHQTHECDEHRQPKRDSAERGSAQPRRPTRPALLRQTHKNRDSWSVPRTRFTRLHSVARRR